MIWPTGHAAVTGWHPWMRPVGACLGHHRCMAGRRGRVAPATFVVAVSLYASLTGCANDASPRPDSAASATPSASVGELSAGVPRAVHRATTLADGGVLITGGCTTPGCGGVEAGAPTVLFDAATEQTTAGPSLRQVRLAHTATLLDDGRVLVAGGYTGEGRPPTGTMEVYDPRRESFESVGSLQVGRADHSASLLADGRVLVAGGRGADGAALSSVEIVDPGRGRVTKTAALPQPRTAHAAVGYDGEVLLLGGTTVSDRAVASAVSFDSATGRWRPGPTLLRARVKHAAVALPGGGVLVIGGSGSAESRDAYADTELLRSGDDRFRPGPRLPEGRYKLTDAAAALPDGRVAVAGGTTVAVLDPATGSTRVVPSPRLGAARAFQTLSPVSDDLVLVMGGYDADIDPTAEAWLVDVG